MTHEKITKILLPPSYFTPPKHIELWQTYFGFLFDHPEQISAMSISFRPANNLCDFKILYSDRTWVTMDTFDLDFANELMRLILPASAKSSDPASFFVDNYGAIADLRISSRDVRIMFLPVYPKSYDFHIETRSSSGSFRTLQSLQLPPYVLTDLLGLVSSKPSGVFAFIGAPRRSGKSTLVQALFAHIENQIHSRHIRHLEINNSHGYPHFGQTISDLLNDGLLVWPEFSSSALRPTVFKESLSDFGVDQNHFQNLIGWASPFLVPIVCLSCASPPLSHSGHNHWCAQCFGTGVARQQMLLNLWRFDAIEQKSVLIQSAPHQATALAQQGLVGWNVVDDMWSATPDAQTWSE